MKNWRTIFGSLLLVVALSSTALAGEMHTPYTSSPSPTPDEVTVQTSDPVETSDQVTVQILIDYLMLVF